MQYLFFFFFTIEFDSRLNLLAFLEKNVTAQRLLFHSSGDFMVFSDLEAGSSAPLTCETALIKVCMASRLPPRGHPTPLLNYAQSTV